MALATLSPPVHSTTTSTVMDSGPNMLLWQLMSNAAAHPPAHPTDVPHVSNPVPMYSPVG